MADAIRGISVYTFIVAGSLLSMTTEMMALLGIAGAGLGRRALATPARDSPPTVGPA